MQVARLPLAPTLDGPIRDRVEVIQVKCAYRLEGIRQPAETPAHAAMANVRAMASVSLPWWGQLALWASRGPGVAGAADQEVPDEC